MQLVQQKPWSKLEMVPPASQELPHQQLMPSVARSWERRPAQSPMLAKGLIWLADPRCLAAIDPRNQAKLPWWALPARRETPRVLNECSKATRLSSRAALAKWEMLRELNECSTATRQMLLDLLAPAKRVTPDPPPPR